MNLKLLLWSLPALLLGAVAAVSYTAPADAGGGRARFDFVPGEMTVAITGKGRNAASYYLPYTLKNPMDDARTPRLYVEVTTETKKTYGDRTDAKVVAAAAKDAKAPDMKSTAELRGKDLAAGGTAHGVANFGNIDPNADEITVKVYGLWDPVVRTRQGKVYNERRVLVLQFRRYGDEFWRPMDPISLLWKDEEVQGEVTELYSTLAEKKAK
jgi:hypothetical protein